jgi:hypothetical protein
MKLLALVIDDRSIVRYLKKVGEPTGAPARAPPRGSPYWSSTVLRCQVAAAGKFARKTLGLRVPPSLRRSRLPHGGAHHVADRANRSRVSIPEHYVDGAESAPGAEAPVGDEPAQLARATQATIAKVRKVLFTRAA